MQNDQTNETTVSTDETVQPPTVVAPAPLSQTAIDAASQAAIAATAAAQAKLAIASANRAKLAAAVAARSAKPDKPVASKPAPASANGQAAAKRVASKPATVAKPTAEAREAAQRAANDTRRLERQAASAAVGAYYSGPSRPFKSAHDRFADINPANGKSASTRQAALMLALITYGGGNMRSDGTFVRGAFTVPARLVNPSAKPGETVRAQPESGCLGNMLGRACDLVSGPTSGREQSATVYRLRIKQALAEIQASFGDKTATAAAKLLASYGAGNKPARAKRATAA